MPSVGRRHAFMVRLLIGVLLKSFMAQDEASNRNYIEVPIEDSTSTTAVSFGHAFVSEGDELYVSAPEGSCPPANSVGMGCIHHFKRAANGSLVYLYSLDSVGTIDDRRADLFEGTFFYTSAIDRADLDKVILTTGLMRDSNGFLMRKRGDFLLSTRPYFANVTAIGTTFTEVQDIMLVRLTGGATFYRRRSYDPTKKEAWVREGYLQLLREDWNEFFTVDSNWTIDEFSALRREPTLFGYSGDLWCGDGPSDSATCFSAIGSYVWPAETGASTGPLYIARRDERGAWSVVQRSIEGVVGFAVSVAYVSRSTSAFPDLVVATYKPAAVNESSSVPPPPEPVGIYLCTFDARKGRYVVKTRSLFDGPEAGSLKDFKIDFQQDPLATCKVTHAIVQVVNETTFLVSTPSCRGDACIHYLQIDPTSIESVRRIYMESAVRQLDPEFCTGTSVAHLDEYRLAVSSPQFGTSGSIFILSASGNGLVNGTFENAYSMPSLSGQMCYGGSTKSIVYDAASESLFVGDPCGGRATEFFLRGRPSTGVSPLPNASPLSATLTLSSELTVDQGVVTSFLPQVSSLLRRTFANLGASVGTIGFEFDTSKTQINVTATFPHSDTASAVADLLRKNATNIFNWEYDWTGWLVGSTWIGFPTTLEVTTQTIEPPAPVPAPSNDDARERELTTLIGAILGSVAGAAIVVVVVWFYGRGPRDDFSQLVIQDPEPPQQRQAQPLPTGVEFGGRVLINVEESNLDKIPGVGRIEAKPQWLELAELGSSSAPSPAR